jgi:HPt (histidine-containing phosphotransfer) domain-containing protein
MAALIAQERMARHPLEILTGDAGVPIEAALAVCAEAEDIGLHPFAVAAARGSAGGWSTPRLHARLQASRPPIGRVISELGLLPPERMRELLATYFASVGATVPAPHPVVAPAATAAQPAPAAPAATPAAPAAAAAWEFPAPARLTIGPELQTELQEMTDSEARQGYEERILGLRGEPPLVPLLDQLYRDLHSLKGTFGFLGARLTQRVVHAMEDALSLCKRRGESLAAVDREALVDALLTGVDLVWRLRDACLRAGDEAGAGVHDGLAAWKADLDRACAALVAACDAHDAASGHDITSEF